MHHDHVQYRAYALVRDWYLSTFLSLLLNAISATNWSIFDSQMMNSFCRYTYRLNIRGEYGTVILNGALVPLITEAQRDNDEDDVEAHHERAHTLGHFPLERDYG